jgi:hypothetical protein
MKSPLLILWVLGVLTISGTSQTPQQSKKKPSADLAPIADTLGLPRVLIVGDSISIGYTQPVRKLLSGIANVHRIPANGGPSKNVSRYAAWLGTSKWDVIHFNHGIHDLRHMPPDGKRQVEPQEYEANLRAIVAKLQTTSAKLIFATTTPIPSPPLEPNRTFGQVDEYNAIAQRVMKELGVAVNDLHAHMLPRFEELHKPKDLHYTPAGSEHLAQKVAAELKSALGK